MKLIIKRNQADAKGLFGNHRGVNFSLYGRCDVDSNEKVVIEKYKLGEHVLASYKITPNGRKPLDFRITVNGIIAGQAVETEDIHTLLELEEAMKKGCRNLKSLLGVMATFGGEQSFEI
jgi:hypothetical protein